MDLFQFLGVLLILVFALSIATPFFVYYYHKNEAKKNKGIVYRRKTGTIMLDYSEETSNEEGHVTEYRNYYEERNIRRRESEGVTNIRVYDDYDDDDDYNEERSGFFDDDDSSNDSFSYDDEYEPVTDITDPQCLDDSEPWDWTF